MTMRYVYLTGCGGYVYKGSGFLVLLGYGGYLQANAALGAQTYLVIEDAQGNGLHVCLFQSAWTDGSALTSNANLNSGVVFHRGVMINGQKLSSSPGNGTDRAAAVECDTLEEAAQLL